MIGQIISHTPTYVWALLAFLVYRGVLASRDREVALRKLAIIPLVMLGLSLSSLSARGVLGSAVWALWLGGMLASAALVFNVSKHAVLVNRSAGAVLQRGSWMPLALMLAIFATRYAVAVATGMQPALAHSLPFATGVTLLFGVFNGIFLGRLARQALAWVRSPAPLMTQVNGLT